MFYNAKDFNYNMEDMISEYLKSLNSESRDNYKIGKGWPDYKDIKSENVTKDCTLKKECKLPLRPLENDINITCEFNVFNFNKTNSLKSANKNDMSLMHELYTEINKLMYPFVKQTLDELEYEGSPVYNGEIDRETLAQMIDRTIYFAKNSSDEVQEIFLEKNPESSGSWTKQKMLRSIIESILLNDIFGIRRPRYKKAKQNYKFINNRYDGMNYYY